MMSAGVVLLLVMLWGAASDRIFSPCAGDAPLACLEAQRVTDVPVVAPGPSVGLSVDELRRISGWGRLDPSVRPWESETVAAGRRIPEPLP